MINIRPACSKDSIKVARLLEESLNNGLERNFTINRNKLLEHVQQTILSADGFAYVVTDDETIVGCFMAELVPHAYCDGYIVNELGIYIKPSVRGGNTFIQLLEAFTTWASIKPDVIMTGFTISQLGATTPYIRRVLQRLGFTKGSEGYYKL